MTEVSQTTHEDRHRALVERLAANLRPVRRLWPVSIRFGLWLILEVGVLAWVGTHTLNDFMRKLEAPQYMLEVALFGAAAIVAAIIALRSAIPGRQVRAGEIAFILGSLVGEQTLFEVGDRAEVIESEKRELDNGKIHLDLVEPAGIDMRLVLVNTPDCVR
jgi:hypothetical protein